VKSNLHHHPVKLVLKDDLKNNYSGWGCDGRHYIKCKKGGPSESV
jgi:hypothetical protein